MSKLTEKTGYLRGLVEGMKLDLSDERSKLLERMVDAMNDIAAAVEQLDDDQQELNDYVESIDDDLTNLESMHEDGDDDFLFGEEDEDDVTPFDEEKDSNRLRVLRPHPSGEDTSDDDADEDMFVGCICPECQHLFCVSDPDLNDKDRLYICPFCNKEVKLKPMEHDNIPIARPADET